MHLALASIDGAYIKYMGLENYDRLQGPLCLKYFVAKSLSWLLRMLTFLGLN